jgi:hypothetical protein
MYASSPKDSHSRKWASSVKVKNQHKMEDSANISYRWQSCTSSEPAKSNQKIGQKRRQKRSEKKA